MTFEQIRLAIEGRMLQWQGVPIHFDGTKTPDTNDPGDTRAVTDAIRAQESWVRLTINHGDSLTAYVGDGPKARRTGLIHVQVFVAESQGSRPAALLADSLAAHLEYWQQGHLSTQAASVRRVGPSDGWYMYLVSVPFSAG